MSVLLITGASGFLGSELVRQAREQGLSIRTICRRPLDRELSEFNFPTDITDGNEMCTIMRGVDTVIHAAGLAHKNQGAQKLRASFDLVNEIGTANVALAAGRSGVRHFVLISSVSVYGNNQRLVQEESKCNPLGAYAQSKYRAELRASEIARSFGMPLTILRFVTIFGEGDPGNVARLIRTIDQGYFVWIGDGSNHKSLIYVKDAARACLLVLRPRTRIVNLYNVVGCSSTVREIVDKTAFHLGRKIPKWRIPDSGVKAISRTLYRATRGRGPVADVCWTIQKWLANDLYVGTRFEEHYGFSASTTISEGLQREISWYLTRFGNKQ